MELFDIKTITWIVFTGWIAGTALLILGRKHKILQKGGMGLVIAGTAIMMIYIAGMWIELGRPLFKTLGETRLWYAFFLPLIGIITWFRWRYKWFLALSICFGLIFLFMNYSHPENFDERLMPALQSPWFVPHVIVYMLGYSLLGASLLVSLKGLFQHYVKNKIHQPDLSMADNFVYLGFSLLTLGLLFGALWAKQAWGHYWTWDPKETWAFLTWLVYLVYLHYRHYVPKKPVTAYWNLALAFVILLVAWFGVNYLPIAGESIHTYRN